MIRRRHPATFHWLRQALRWGLVLTSTLSNLACSEPATPDPAVTRTTERDLTVVPRPTLDAVEPFFARHLDRLHAEAERQRAEPASEPASVAASFGQLGQHYAAFGFLESAAAALRVAETAAPADPRWPYLRGVVVYDRGELVLAAAAFRRALELRPDDAAASLRLGTIHLELDQPSEARRWLRSALELDPTSALTHQRLGELAAATGDDPAAVASFRAALELQPEATAVHYALGQALGRLGDPAATTHLERAGDRQARAEDPLLAELGDIVHLVAFEAVTTAIHNVEGFDAHATLELALRHLGNVEGAAERIERYLGDLRQGPSTLTPRLEARYHFLIGGLFGFRGDDARTIEHLSSAVNLAGDFVDAHLLLANALGRAQRLEAALHHYSAALAIDGDHLAARERRAVTYYRLGRYGEAVTDLEAAVELGPDSMENRTRLALARSKAGEPPS